MSERNEHVARRIVKQVTNESTSLVYVSSVVNVIHVIRVYFVVTNVSNFAKSDISGQSVELMFCH